jgi:hypothetical protein
MSGVVRYQFESIFLCALFIHYSVISSSYIILSPFIVDMNSIHFMLDINYFLYALFVFE